MDIYFTIKISCNRKVQVSFCANVKVLMLYPLLLTLKFFRGNGAGCQVPARILPPGALASWALGQLRAQLVTLKTAMVKKVRRKLSQGCPHFPWELLLCQAFHPGFPPELCCCNATDVLFPGHESC